MFKWLGLTWMWIAALPVDQRNHRSNRGQGIVRDDACSFFLFGTAVLIVLSQVPSAYN
jgi:hypothetical protein